VYTLFYRNLGNYRQIIKTPKLEVCGLIKNAFSPGPFNQMMQVLVNASHGMIHVCPYRLGPFNIYNYTSKDADLTFIPIPNGDYKGLFQFSGDDDPQMGNISSKSTIKTDAAIKDLR